MQQTIILCPLYNDEASFNIFAEAIERQLSGITDMRFSFLVINDGTPELSLNTTIPITIVHLHRNIGHQKAIAIGIAYAHHHLEYDNLIIMDCDGEDKPEDIISLIKASPSGEKVVAAKRTNRQEGKGFRFFYTIYKWMFFILTGRRIAFGNFMLIPKKITGQLVHYSEIWNHLAGAIIKSRVPLLELRLRRGKRYEGKSKMNFTSLLLHGLGAIGVFIEIIASRLLIFSLVMIGLSVLAIVIITYIKLFTSEAIPGWASTVVSSLLIVLLQSFLLSLFTIFLYLSFQGQRKFIPAHHYDEYVRSIETIHHD